MYTCDSNGSSLVASWMSHAWIGKQSSCCSSTAQTTSASSALSYCSVTSSGSLDNHLHYHVWRWVCIKQHSDIQIKQWPIFVDGWMLSLCWVKIVNKGFWSVMRLKFLQVGTVKISVCHKQWLVLLFGCVHSSFQLAEFSGSMCYWFSTSPGSVWKRTAPISTWLASQVILSGRLGS